MPDEIKSSTIKPVYFQKKKELPDRILDHALGEIKADKKIDEKFKELAFQRSIGAGKHATERAAQEMGTNSNSTKDWIYSTAAQFITGAKPADFGKQVQDQFKNNSELSDFVHGMTKIGTAASAIQQTKNINPDIAKMRDPNKEDDVMEALAHIGRGEKPSAKSVGEFFDIQRDKINGSEKLSDAAKQKYLEAIDGQEKSTLDVLKNSQDKQVDVSTDVLEHMVKMDPDFTKFYNPLDSLSALTKDTLEYRSQKAIEDGFPDKAFYPSDLTFSEKNLSTAYNRDTVDAAKGIDKVLKPFDEGDTGFFNAAQGQILNGINKEIEKAKQENES